MTAFDRKTGVYKPAAMEHVRLGGWVELTVGEWTGASECVVFGYVVAISGSRITIQIADDVFSPTKTGLERDQLITFDLEDISGSEFSPFAIEMEATQAIHEIEDQLIEQHQAEYDAFCPPEYRFHIERTRNASPEEYHAWCEGRMRVRHEFVEQLVRRQSTNQ
jgi:hypothetical protein